MADVEVKFGASVSETLAGVDRVKKALGEIGPVANELNTRTREAQGGLSNLSNVAQQSTRTFGSAASAANQLSFQINDLITQISSGTSVQQALIQQSGQILQIFQTNAGAADLLSRALGALQSPLGLVAVGVGTLAGAFVILQREASQAAEEIRKVQNASLAAGRDPAFAGARVREMAGILQRQGIQNRGSATAAAGGIEGIAALSNDSKIQLTGILQAFARVNTGNDIPQAIEQLSKVFSSLESMQATVVKNRLLTGNELQEILGTSDERRAASLLTRGLVTRYTPTVEQMQSERLAFPFQALGVPVPRALTPHPEGVTRLEFPSDEEIKANRLIAEGNKELQKRADLVERIATIRRALGNNEVRDLEAARSAIKAYEQEIEAIDQRRNKTDRPASIMQRLEAELSAQNAAIMERASGRGGGGGFSDSLQSMIAAANEAGLDIGITSGTRTRERQQQLWDAALRKYGSAAAARKWVAPPGSSMHERGMAADLRFGPGAREWAHENASRFGLTFPLGNEPWHIEPMGGRSGAGGGRATAQQDILRNTLDFWTSQRANAQGSDLIAIEDRIADARRRLAENTLQEQERAERETTRLSEQHAREREKTHREFERFITAELKKEHQERIQDQKRAAQEQKAEIDNWAAPFRSAFSGIEGSLSSGVSGMITGRTTPLRSLQSLGDTAVSGLTSSVVSTLSKFGARALGATKGESLGDLAANWIGEGLFGIANTGAEVAHSAAMTGHTAAMTAHTGALLTSAGVSGVSTAGSVVGGIGGAVGGIGKLAGTAAGVAAAPATGGLSLLGTIGSWLFGKRGMIVPSAAGGWALPSFPGIQPALLHAEEMVLPAPISKGIQNAISGGGFGSGMTFNLNAVAADGPAIERLFRNNGRLITDAVRAGLRSNALTPRSI
ncbi:MAG: D-alanyl-D-alanine carboxypeptidase family protein [Alphaproteobacteria bacterium]